GGSGGGSGGRRQGVPAKIPKAGSGDCVTWTRIRQAGRGCIGSGLEGNVLRSCIARTASARCAAGASSVENRNGLVAPHVDIISDPLKRPICTDWASCRVTKPGAL